MPGPFFLGGLWFKGTALREQGQPGSQGDLRNWARAACVPSWLHQYWPGRLFLLLPTVGAVVLTTPALLLGVPWSSGRQSLETVSVSSGKG